MIILQCLAVATAALALLVIGLLAFTILTKED